MKVPRIYRAIITCTTLLVSCKALYSSKEISFDRLNMDESIQVKFDSRGCFHHQTFLLRFEMDSAGVTQLATFSQSGERRSPVALRRTDLNNLNLLMEWYRHNRKSGCTTVDTITVTKFRAGAKITEEHFTDDSCELGGRIEMPTFSSFWKRAGGT